MAHYVDYTKVIDKTTGKLLPDILQESGGFNPDNYYDKATIDSKITTTKTYTDGKPFRYIRIVATPINGNTTRIFAGELQAIDTNGTNLLLGLLPIASMSSEHTLPERLTDGKLASSSAESTATVGTSSSAVYLTLDIGQAKSAVLIKFAAQARGSGTVLAVDISLDSSTWYTVFSDNTGSCSYSAYTDIDLRTTEIVPAWQVPDEDLQDQVNSLNGRVTDLENTGPQKRGFPKARYVRNTIAGNSDDSKYSTFREIDVYGPNGIISIGKPVTYEGPAAMAGKNNPQIITNGNTVWSNTDNTGKILDIECYGQDCTVTIDLETVCEITQIKLYHYIPTTTINGNMIASERRYYLKNIVEISEDGQNWTRVYSNDTHGVQFEVPNGHTIIL